MANVQRVLIVGGGIGGLTLAAALRQGRIECEVVEQNSEWEAVGAGLSVQPNGLRVLRELGLDAAVLSAGTVVTRWLFGDQQGDVLCQVDLESVWGNVGPCVGVARARLQEVLVAGTRSVPCRLGTSVVSIEQADESVTVVFTDSSTGTYDLVVGADGIHSKVRALVFGNIEPTFAGQISWRSLAPVTLTGPPSIQFWLGDHCFFGLCSVGHGGTYGFANVTRERQHDPAEGRLARLRTNFSDFGSPVQDYLTHLDDDSQIHCSSIEWIEQERWRLGRVVLIGDAAHATSPMMGQGGSLAMEDAWVLGNLLNSEVSLDEALAEYVRRRTPRVRWVQQQSRAVAETFDRAPLTRNEVLRTKGASMFMERYLPLTLNP